MGSGSLPSLRSLPRAFVEGMPDPAPESFELPREEFDKFHKVLRLGSGDQVALLPGDGRVVRCVLQGREAEPLETVRPETEPKTRLTLALGLPKPEKLEESVRMATEIGAAGFVLFSAERSVVRWSEDKVAQKTDRLRRIAREASEVCFRTRLPSFAWEPSLGSVLERYPDALVLSEGEGVRRKLEAAGSLPERPVLVIGPEGGWAPQDVKAIGDRAVTLGPRVLRVDTAVAAACTLVLLDRS
ncbi:MAG: 16S rRNA (uracil(1498)-N(3))-methyltransferase [Armatimonadetes bacterium]|nr:16S rRNA (uracil(1498)-N(3))-methyltransferase [Armatimonadota bacterium]